MKPKDSLDARKPNVLRSFWLKRRLEMGPSSEATTGWRGQQRAIAKPTPAGERFGALSVDRGCDFNRPTNELDDFISRRDQGDVDKAPLNLRPIVPGLPAQARSVSVERLMKNADDNKFA